METIQELFPTKVFIWTTLWEEDGGVLWTQAWKYVYGGVLKKLFGIV